MSLGHIAQQVVTKVNTEWVSTPIANPNVNYSDNPSDYIELKGVVPVSDDRELISSATPFNTVAIYQINIKRKNGLGNGSMLSYNEDLKAMFRETIINDVIFYKTDNLSIIEEGDYQILPLRLYCEYRN